MPPRLVLDTNVLLVSVSERSRYHYVFDAFRRKRYTLCLTTDIVLEYHEVLARHMGRATADAVLANFGAARNVDWVTRYFRWQMIVADPDDDKFVDCAVAAGAAILTEDRHFDAAKAVAFPPVQIISVSDFETWLAPA